jgi:hypothetical protein
MFFLHRQSKKKHFRTVDLEEQFYGSQRPVPIYFLFTSELPASNKNKMAETATNPPRDPKESGLAPIPKNQVSQGPTLDRAITENTEIRARTTKLPFCRMRVYNQHGHPGDAMSCTHAKPTEPLNVAEALELPPQPNTFQHQLQQLKESGGEKQTRNTTGEDKKAEFERVKNTLRAWKLP